MIVIGAALAAARNGAKTLLVEDSGMPVLTREEVMTARKFPDAVACHANYIDMHDPDGGHGSEAGSGDACHPAEADRQAAGRGTLHLRRPCGAGLDPQSLRAVLKEQDVYL